MKILVAGGTGFIGKAIVEKLLSEQHEVVALVRRNNPYENHSNSALKTLIWDGRFLNPETELLQGVEAVINLAGEGIAEKRWSASQKEKIIKTRVESTRAILQWIEKTIRKPAVWVNASAVGFYGGDAEGVLTEEAPKGKGFLADTCATWETEAFKADRLGVRVVLMRIGVVIEKGGGALEKFIPPFSMFIGGPLGSGKQPFNWIHRDDVIGAFHWALTDERLRGPVNLVAPQLLTMNEFCESLGKAMHKPSWAPVPGFVLKLALGEVSDMILKATKVKPEKLQKVGYPFRYPDADSALRAVFSRTR